MLQLSISTMWSPLTIYFRNHPIGFENLPHIWSEQNTVFGFFFARNVPRWTHSSIPSSLQALGSPTRYHLEIISFWGLVDWRRRFSKIKVFRIMLPPRSNSAALCGWCHGEIKEYNGFSSDKSSLQISDFCVRREFRITEIQLFSHEGVAQS